MQTDVMETDTETQVNLRRMDNRLSHLEDLMTDVLESGREMDANITSQIDDLKFEISLQHDMLKKLKVNKCSRFSQLMAAIVALFVLWIYFLIKY